MPEVQKVLFLLFDNLKIKAFNIYSLKNLGVFEISNIEPLDDSSSIYFQNLEFSDAIFRNVNVIQFENVYVINSDLSSLKLYNSVFPIEMSGKYEDLYEIYN